MVTEDSAADAAEGRSGVKKDPEDKSLVPALLYDLNVSAQVIPRLQLHKKQIFSSKQR